MSYLLGVSSSTEVLAKSTLQHQRLIVNNEQIRDPADPISLSGTSGKVRGRELCAQPKVTA